MRSEFRLAARTVVCLALAVTSLGAAPIYHRVYQGQASLISEPVTCSISVAIDDQGNFAGGGESGCAGAVILGSLVYVEGPVFDLPPDSVILSAELHQWGYFNIAQEQMLSVEPMDPTKPFSAFEMYVYSIDVLMGGCCGDPRFSILGSYHSSLSVVNFHPSFDVLDTDYARYLTSVPWEAGQVLPLTISEAELMEPLVLYDSPYYPTGLNSVTTLTNTFALTGSAAFYSLDITYEAPVPEPATASLFGVGAAGLLLLRRVRRTRQP